MTLLSLQIMSVDFNTTHCNTDRSCLLQLLYSLLNYQLNISSSCASKHKEAKSGLSGKRIVIRHN